MGRSEPFLFYNVHGFNNFLLKKKPGRLPAGLLLEMGY